MFFKRMHLFEFNDQSWLPNPLRVTQMELLKGSYETFHIFRNVIGKVTQVVQHTQDTKIQLLCAGAGGPAEELLQTLLKSGCHIRLVLSDKFPNISKYKELAQKHKDIEFIEQPVDVFEMPQDLEGTRIIINAVHHFKPEQVRNILSEAIRQNKAIIFLEPTQRTILFFFTILFSFPVLMFLGIVIRPFSLRRVFFTTIFPIATFITVFDGLVSCLRAYKPKEWTQMYEQIPGHENFSWEVGEISGFPMHSTYLTGYPK